MQTKPGRLERETEELLQLHWHGILEMKQPSRKNARENCITEAQSIYLSGT